MHDSPSTHPTRFGRRAGTLVAVLAVAVGSAAAIGASAASADPGTTLTLNLPTAIGNGGDLQSASATIDNSGGAAVANARVDFDITPATSTANLAPGDIVLKYETSPGSGTYQTIPLTADASGGGVNGYFGPVGGFPIPAGAVSTTALQVTTNPSAPTGGIHVTANLDTTPGDATSEIATDSKDIALSTPTLTFDSVPTTITPGDNATFTGTLANTTGSNYGGAAPSNNPSPAGVRLDFSIASSNPAITDGDFSLQYCLNGTDASCTGGTWTDIPLTLSGSTLTGYFGPTGGFALPNTATNTTPFRIETSASAPNSTFTSTVTLDKVDSSGSPTGTDSSGVDNGPITSAQPGAVFVGTVVNPTITAAVSSAHPKTSYGAHGWYNSAVMVTFTCTPGSADLTAPCPGVRTFLANGKDHTVTKTITATDGGTASVTVDHINIDKTHPHIHVVGAKNGGTYSTRKHLTATCSDHLSGVALCKVTSTRSNNKVKFTATVKDKANNKLVKKGSYRIKK